MRAANGISICRPCTRAQRPTSGTTTRPGGHITVTPGADGQTRHTVTLSLSGTAAFGAALRERFGLD